MGLSGNDGSNQGDGNRWSAAPGMVSPLAPHPMTFAGAPLTLGLIVFMTVVHLATEFMSGYRSELLYDYAASSTRTDDLVRGPAPLIEVYRLITYSFLHGDLLHLGLNMAAMAILGPPVERALGQAAYVLFWIVTAIGGALGHWAWEVAALALEGHSLQTIGVRGSYLVGASGAIFGLLAADVWMRTQGLKATPPSLRGNLPAPMTYFMRMTILMLAINAGISLLGAGIGGAQISGSAHIGGYLIGLAAAALLLRDRSSGRSSPPPPQRPTLH